jgi:hypothetical protein
MKKLLTSVYTNLFGAYYFSIWESYSWFGLISFQDGWRVRGITLFKRCFTIEKRLFEIVRKTTN